MEVGRQHHAQQHLSRQIITALSFSACVEDVMRFPRVVSYLRREVSIDARCQPLRATNAVDIHFDEKSAKLTRGAKRRF